MRATITHLDDAFGKKGYDNQVDHNGDFIFGCRPWPGVQGANHGAERSFFQKYRIQTRNQMNIKLKLKPIGDYSYEQQHVLYE